MLTIHCFSWASCNTLQELGTLLPNSHSVILCSELLSAVNLKKMHSSQLDTNHIQDIEYHMSDQEWLDVYCFLNYRLKMPTDFRWKMDTIDLYSKEMTIQKVKNTNSKFRKRTLEQFQMTFYYCVFKIFKFRSSHQRCSIKKAVLKNVIMFTVKRLCQSPFLIKLQAYNFIKKRLQPRILESLAAKQVFFCEHYEIKFSALFGTSICCQCCKFLPNIFKFTEFLIIQVKVFKGQL